MSRYIMTLNTLLQKYSFRNELYADADCKLYTKREYMRF